MGAGIVAAGAGPTVVVLFPGALGRAESVRPALEFLATKRRVIALDYPALALHPERVADTVIELLESERRERAHFVGFSLGAEVARQTALLAPSRVASLVLVGAGAPDRRRGDRVARMLPFVRLLPAFVLRRRWRAEIGSLLRADDAESDAARWRLFDLLRRMGRREFVAARERLVTLDWCAIAGRVVPPSIPALLLDPAADEVIPASERELRARLIPHAVVEALPGMGHGATLTLPRPLLERIDAWLPV
jgi:pimeloyl-ACP methyl ester carboxylesterase